MAARRRASSHHPASWRPRHRPAVVLPDTQTDGNRPEAVRRPAVAGLCYKWYKMGTIIRNLDEKAYRAIRARAVIEGRTVGELITEAIRRYVARPAPGPGNASVRDLRPESFPDGNEDLSAGIDAIVYGVSR